MPEIRIGALVKIDVLNSTLHGQTGIVVSSKGKGQSSDLAGERWVVMCGETSKDINWFYENELEVIA